MTGSQPGKKRLKYQDGETLKLNKILVESLFVDDKGDLKSIGFAHPGVRKESNKYKLINKKIKAKSIPPEFIKDEKFKPQFTMEEKKDGYPLNRGDGLKVSHYYVITRIR